MDRVIYLVRHTRTVAEEGICYGQSDIDVSEDFDLESAVILNKLKGISFDLVYSSPFKRCHKLASFLAPNIILDKRLMEMNFGEWELQTWDHIFSLPEGEAWFADYINKRCPKGESFNDLLQRVNDFMLAISNAKGNILIVTHAGVIRALATCFGLTTVDSAFDLPVPFGVIFKIEKNKLIVV